MNKKLYCWGIILLIISCSIILFACRPNPVLHPEDQRPEFIITDYKNVMEMTINSETLIFYSYYSEDMIYSYQFIDEDTKADESYEAKIGEDWYLYEMNSFEYWKRSVIDNPYDVAFDEIGIYKEDFYIDSDDYYAIKSEKLGSYSDTFSEFENVNLSGLRVKFNEDELPVEVLLSMTLSDYDTDVDAKVTFEYNTGETFDLPEQYVPSYNIKINQTSTYSQTINNCWMYDNVAYSFYGDVGSSIGWLEIDVYGDYVSAHLVNNSWQYSDYFYPESLGFNMIEVMDNINFDDFITEGDNLVLKSDKLSEYAPIIEYNANPGLIVLSDLRIKVTDGKIVQMIFTSYFRVENYYDEDGVYIEGETTEPVTSTLTFEYDVLTYEDLP